jgi:prepilin-type N-terminal cleavage/methylation domain-containing protein
MYLNFQENQGKARAKLGCAARVAFPERSCNSSFSHSGDTLSLQSASRSISQSSSLSFFSRQAGFTLIELLVVISLVGLLAVGIVVALDGVGDDAQLQIARAEIAEVKKALQQFKRDVGRYPQQAHPADFTELILGLDALDNTQQLAPWNPDTARGWRGPYLSSEGNGYVTIGNNLQEDGSGSPTAGTAYPDYRPGVADPFADAPVVSGANTYLEWLPCADCEGKARTSWGRPYYAFDLGDIKKARIISSGSDGTYKPKVLNEDDVCADIFALQDEYDDDIILCLQ